MKQYQKEVEVSGKLQLLFDFERLLEKYNATANNISMEFYPVDDVKKFIQISINSTFTKLPKIPLINFLGSENDRGKLSQYVPDEESTRVSIGETRIAVKCKIFAEFETEEQWTELTEKIEKIKNGQQVN